jgi:hypothetical protein
MPIQRDGNGFPVLQSTISDVFIIESLNIADENASRFEGKILCDILRMADKHPKYYYFESKEELRHIVGLFRESRYRYLHISSHADDGNIFTKNGNITYQEFSSIFEGHLKLRRLFFSACEIGNDNFFSEVFRANNGMHSIIGPNNVIGMDHAIAFWSSFYISLFAENEDGITHDGIKKRVKALISLYPIIMKVATYNPRRNKWRSEIIRD